MPRLRCCSEKNEWLCCYHSYFLVIGIVYALNDATNPSTGNTRPDPVVNAPDVASKVVRNPIHQKIVEMSERDRWVFFKEYLNRSNKRCSDVNRTFFQGFDSDSHAYWSVSCFDGNAYIIGIDDDAVGSTRILEKEILELLGIELFKKFDE